MVSGNHPILTTVVEKRGNINSVFIFTFKIRKRREKQSCQAYLCTSEYMQEASTFLPELNVLFGKNEEGREGAKNKLRFAVYTSQVPLMKVSSLIANTC